MRHTFPVLCSSSMSPFLSLSLSPKYNYFNGLSVLAPPHLDDLHRSILSEFKLGPKERATFDALNVWTMACEISVANALCDCFGDLEAMRSSMMKQQ
jgi:hypothetical protein